ncbi:MAG TPA: YceI family protein [Candidatus Omnitrophota bacterium]|nr:YceI family protein [Candidatus Omnitrophota bacterium]
MNKGKNEIWGVVRWGVMASVLMVSFLLSGGRAGAADIFQIDRSHSSIGFALKHLTISTVTGEFTDYSGTIQYDAKDPAAFTAEVMIQAATIDTHQKKRDDHLRGADFFDTEKFPIISFKSKKCASDANGYLLTGDLTMHGVTKEISIPLTISGPVKSPMGSDVIGVSAETTINRQDFGVSWNKALDTGGFMVGDEVKISVNLEAHKK